MSHPHLSGDAFNEAVRQAARCRASRRHRFEVISPPVGAPTPLYGSLLAQRCDLCGTVRYDSVNRFTGEVYSYTYDYPEWYEAANEDRQDASWWRATYWSSLDASLFLEAPATKRRRA